MISPKYYPHIGGVEYVVKSVAERLSKKGHSVTVLCGEEHAYRPREEVINNVYIIRWPIQAPGGAYHIPKIRSDLKELLLKSIKDYDLVHFHSIHSVLTIYSLKILKDPGVRKILTPYYHGTGHTFFRRILWRGWRSYVKRLIRFVDVVHTVSKLEAQLIKRDFKVDAIPIENGVDEWVLNFQWSPSGYVMYSGRIEKYKNIHRLASIIKILNTKHDFNFELKIYGSGQYINSLNKHLRKIGIKYSINEAQPFEKYIETLSNASLFGLLSEKESYPQSVNEANAIGTPVVIAKPWGINFNNRSRTLIVDLTRDDYSIANEIRDFMERCAKEPRSKVPSWNEVTEQYIKYLYEPRTISQNTSRHIY